MAESLAERWQFNETATLGNSVGGVDGFWLVS